MTERLNLLDKMMEHKTIKKKQQTIPIMKFGRFYRTAQSIILKNAGERLLRILISESKMTIDRFITNAIRSRWGEKCICPLKLSSKQVCNQRNQTMNKLYKARNCGRSVLSVALNTISVCAWECVCVCVWMQLTIVCYSQRQICLHCIAMHTKQRFCVHWLFAREKMRRLEFESSGCVLNLITVYGALHMHVCRVCMVWKNQSRKSICCMWKFCG